MNESSYTCPRCQATSYNTNDIREGYCGKCHDWTRHEESVKPTRCPCCNYQLDCATAGDASQPSSKPRPGDFSVCINCVEVLVFTDTLDLRQADLNDLISSPAARRHIGRVQAAIRATKSSHRK